MEIMIHYSIIQSIMELLSLELNSIATIISACKWHSSGIQASINRLISKFCILSNGKIMDNNDNPWNYEPWLTKKKI